MQCNRCGDDPVIFQPYSGRNLCRDHFIADFGARAKRAIRQHRWMQPGDHIAVPITGDRATAALHLFLQELTGRRADIRITAVRMMPRDCDSETHSYVEMAAGIGATRVALPASLDDIAVSVLSDLLGGMRGAAHKALSRETAGTVPCIYPFSQIPGDEIVLYAQLQGVGRDLPPRDDAIGTYQEDVRELLHVYSARHHATKYAVARIGDQLASCGLVPGEGLP